MKKFLFVFLAWLPLAGIITGLCLLVYAGVQQSYRQSANDPQIQMAEDGTALLREGVQPQNIGYSVGAQENVDLAHSIAPYMIVFDNEGKVLASSASLDGETPVPPAGVFEYARKHDEDRFTWEPKQGVRSAAVLKYHEENLGGFVLTGRSLREVEKRESQLFLMVLITWLAALILSLVYTVALCFLVRKDQ